jgi:hypothetical protein
MTAALLTVVLWSKSGDSERITVKPSRYRKGFLAVLLAGSVITLQAQETLKEKAEKTEVLLKSGKFDQAEPLARECLQQEPEEIYFLSQLEMALHGQSKFQQADELAERTRRLWKNKYKDKWIARGSPAAESAWARVMTTTQDYYVIGTEYFMPHMLAGNAKDGATLEGFYKVILQPVISNGTSRLFFLNKARQEHSYFLEEVDVTGSWHMVAAYGHELPPLREIVKVVVEYLDK